MNTLLKTALVLSVFSVTALLTLGVCRYLYPTLIVEGESMYPTLKEGETLRAMRLNKVDKRFLIPGMIYVFHIYDCDKENGKPYYFIKRLDHIYVKPNGEIMCYFLGDNSDNSNDSRHFGYVSASNVIAMVLNKLEVL